jgi:hypothetical protein
VRKPSFADAILLGLIPFVAMCFSIALWDLSDGLRHPVQIVLADFMDGPKFGVHVDRVSLGDLAEQ